MSIESLKAKGHCILTWNEIRNMDLTEIRSIEERMKKKTVKKPVKKTRKPKPRGTY